MRLPRASGILLHPTSLPGRHGIGDLGEHAHAFVDFLGHGRPALVANPASWDRRATAIRPISRLPPSPATPC